MQQTSRARITLYDGLSGRTARPAPTAGPVAAPPGTEVDETDGKAAALKALLAAKRRPLIEAALEAIRPNLKRDGGDCVLVDIKGDAVYLKLSGACVGCQLASMTLGGIRQKLIEATGLALLRVIPVT